jgi:nucleoid-associated protein YgaU
MKFTHLIKPLFIVMLALGLVAGCATDGGSSDSADYTAEQAIANAKSTNAKAKKMGAEWRDTGKIIKSAEAAMAAGDEEKAKQLAGKAQRQAEFAMQQAKDENARLLASGAISGSAASSSESGVMAGDDSYQVMTGDNLWNISGKEAVYANPYQWPLIYKANRDKIKDADLIYAGQVFDIDRNASSSDVNAAIEHAKTRGAWSVGTVEASDEAYLAE